MAVSGIETDSAEQHIHKGTKEASPFKDMTFQEMSEKISLRVF